MLTSLSLSGDLLSSFPGLEEGIGKGSNGGGRDFLFVGGLEEGIGKGSNGGGRDFLFVGARGLEEGIGKGSNGGGRDFLFVIVGGLEEGIGKGSCGFFFVEVWVRSSDESHSPSSSSGGVVELVRPSDILVKFSMVCSN